MTRRLVAASLALFATASFAAAPAAAKRPSPPTVDYRAEGDGPAFMATDPMGRTWSTWSYTRGLEVDVAISMEVNRTWTTPVLLGTPGVDDLDPRIAFLPDGTLVAVWWQRGATPAENRVVSSTLGEGGWSTPVPVVNESSSNPSLFVAGGMLTVAYQDAAGAVRTAPAPAPAPSSPATEGSARQVEKPDPDPDPDGGTNGPDPMPTIIIKPGNRPI